MASAGGYCPRCGSALDAGSAYCSRCGSPQTPPAAAECPSCGNPIPDGGRFCVACGRPAPEPAPAAGQRPADAPGPTYAAPPPYGLSRPAESGRPPHIPNYLGWAILSTICCCLFTGIVSIVYAAQVNGKIARGDIDGAQQCSNNARTWAWVSFGLGIAGWIIYGFTAAAGPL